MNRVSLALVFIVAAVGCRSAGMDNTPPPGVDPLLVASAVEQVSVEHGARATPKQRQDIAKQIIAEAAEGWTGRGEERFRRYAFGFILRSGSMSPAEMQQVVIEAKARMIEPAADAELARASSEAKVTLTENAALQMRQDMQEYAMEMALGGLPIPQMQNMINGYIRNIIHELMQKAGETAVDVKDYAAAQLHIFERLVRVKFDSVPRFAIVSFEGRPVGQTTITVPMTPGKSYHLMMERNGYERFTRRLLVLPTEVDQIFTAHLQPNHDAGPTPPITTKQ